MKKALNIGMVVLIVLCLTGCGDTKVIKGVRYDTYGLFNKDDKQNENIEYQVIVGNVVWSCILVETVIAPIYFLGFSLYEPVGVKSEVIKGEVSN